MVVDLRGASWGGTVRSSDICGSGGSADQVDGLPLEVVVDVPNKSGLEEEIDCV